MMSVGPVSIHIMVWVSIIEYIPIPNPFFSLLSNPRNAPMKSIWTASPMYPKSSITGPNSVEVRHTV